MLVQQAVFMMRDAARNVKGKLAQLEATGGQGTSEYAILIGVVVFGAVLLVMGFSGQLNAVWQKAVNGMTTVVNYMPSGKN